MESIRPMGKLRAVQFVLCDKTIKKEKILDIYEQVWFYSILFNGSVHFEGGNRLAI